MITRNISDTVNRRSFSSSSANTETIHGTVKKVYTDALNNVTHADVRPVGSPQDLRHLENASGVNLWTGANCTLNYVRGNRFDLSITGAADGGTGANIAGAAANVTAGMGETTGTDADLSGVPILLTDASPDVAPDGVVLFPGANVLFEDTPSYEASGGTVSAIRRVSAVPVVATSLPSPTLSGYPHGTCLDLVDSYSNALGMFRLDLPAGEWRRRDSGTGSGDGGGSTTVIPISLGGTGQTTSLLALAALGGEPALGNPGTNGYLLSSTTLGVRSWVAPGYTPSGISNQTLRFSGTNTLSASSLLANTGTRIGINTTTPSAALLEIYDNGSSTNGTAFIFSDTAKGATSGGGIGLCANWLMRAQGERLGYIYFQGKNNNSGGSIINAVAMEAFANEDWVGGNYGSYWTLGIMPNGTTTRSEVIRATGTAVGIKNTAPHSTLTIGGSFARATRTVTSGSVTLDATDYRVRASGGVTITLPTAVGITGREYLIKMVGSGTVTINTTSSQTIDGSVGTTITATNGFLRLVSNGADWETE